MLDEAAREHIAAAYDEWRAGFTLPALASEITPGFKDLAMRMYRLYGLDAITEMKRVATERARGGEPQV